MFLTVMEILNWCSYALWRKTNQRFC